MIDVREVALRGPSFTLSLADGSRWAVAASDSHLAGVIVEDLAGALGIRHRQGPPGAADHLLAVAPDGVTALPDTLLGDRAPRPRWELSARWADGPARDDDEYPLVVASAGMALAREMARAGHVLIHAALAEHGRQAVALAGAGGVGKTTAASHLPPGWTAPSDDQCLLVDRGPAGIAAHPWPTWAVYVEGGVKRSWPVARALHLNGVGFLRRASHVAVERLEAPAAAVALFESSQQVHQVLGLRLPADEERELHLARFSTCCSLARQVPCFRLETDLGGDIERALDAIVADGLPQGRS